MNYDIIGDIHGHASALTALLERMGYRKRSGVYGLDGHTAIFVGDLVDRGPEIRETVAIVRAMVGAGGARCVMGNHEYNAICFHVPRSDQPHRWLRSRTDRHLHQHIETLYQFRNHQDEWADHLAWFRTLPLFLDLGVIRVVHAAWHEPSLEVLRRFSDSGNVLTDDLLCLATRRENGEFDAMQNVVKGVEVDLPGAHTFIDKDGNERREMRVRWWLDASGRNYSEIALGDAKGVKDLQIRQEDARRLTGYRDPIPVFFGHYWFVGSSPSILSPYAACVDYSVAMGGCLVAYRWRGEKELTDNHFVCHE